MAEKMMEQTENPALKTLKVMPRHNKPQSWTISDQLEIDNAVKKEQLAIREAKKTQNRPNRLLKMPV